MVRVLILGWVDQRGMSQRSKSHKEEIEKHFKLQVRNNRILKNEINLLFKYVVLRHFNCRGITVRMYLNILDQYMIETRNVL